MHEADIRHFWKIYVIEKFVNNSREFHWHLTYRPSDSSRLGMVKNIFINQNISIMHAIQGADTFRQAVGCDARFYVLLWWLIDGAANVHLYQKVFSEVKLSCLSIGLRMVEILLVDSPIPRSHRPATATITLGTNSDVAASGLQSRRSERDALLFWKGEQFYHPHLVAWHQHTVT